MDEKVVIVTGASTGIGEGIAVHFAEIGYKKLVLVARRENLLNETAAKCKAKGATDVLVLPRDLAVTENNRNVIEETIKHFGRLDVLINNAAYIGNVAPIEEMKMEVFERVYHVNVRGPFAMSQAALPHLVETKGNILFITSIYGTSPQKGWIQYNTTKAALKMMTKIFALELADRGVRVNMLSPGFIDTEIFYTPESNTGLADRDECLDVLGQRTPLGRMGTSEEMAKVAAFLVSEGNSFMTGSDIFSDGGFILTSQLPKVYNYNKSS